MNETVAIPRNPTPMFRQFFEIKDRHPGCILLFRCGDFYEMYGEDAEKGAKMLEIALTARDGGGGEKIAMAGVPYHALDGYLKVLIQKGARVAICEQMEDPKKAKGLVKRDVTRVVTSGTITDSKLLPSVESNYLMAIVSSGENFGLAYTDISTGEFKTTFIPRARFSLLLDEIFRVRPSEALLHQELQRIDQVKKHLEELNIPWTVTDEPLHGEIFREILKSALEGDKADINWDEAVEAGMASAALVQYMSETQKTARHSSYKIELYSISRFMILDAATWRNLELTHTMIEHKRKGSLLWVLDKTGTAMGARLLRSWLERPLMDIEQINARLDAVEELLNNYTLLTNLSEKLKNIYDLERITSRVIYGSANARDILALRNSMANLPGIKEFQNSVKSSLLTVLLESLDPLEDIHSLVDSSIAEDPPMTLKEGNIIKTGYNAELDELREIRSSARGWIAGLEQTEREKTGIKSLKVKFNNVFGYFIEVTKSNLHLVPEDYIRKQTIANGERFISPELKEYESKVLGAEEKIIDLEYRLFIDIRNRIMAQASRIQGASRIIGNMDCLASLALTAREGNYCRPEIAPGRVVKIQGGRHPVVEKFIDEGFVPNDTIMDERRERFHIITGPNMSGKSTYLRQVGLIAIMAQIGSFVPAVSAQMGLVDRVFTRVGASDNLYQGKSTFLVEMSETANIIKNATNRSLILLDEIGRGTSTYDGMSIAWAVTEYIHNRIQSRSLFATHFHQLNELAGLHKGIRNYRVEVKETNQGIIFLHRIVPGGTDKSYGIYVAKLAGLPGEVLRRAGDILEELENRHAGQAEEKPKSKETAYQLTFFDLLANPLTEELKSLNPDQLTPREALDKLYEWKRKID